MNKFIKNSFCLRDISHWLFLVIIILILFNTQLANGQEGEEWITYQPNVGPGNGKYIVLVSGDEEYRSEEALPMLAKILANQHGFKTTVLFSINPGTGEIDPDYQSNIPGLHNLQSADLMVIFTRYRELENDQMKYIKEYLQHGKPIVGLRTATHAFQFDDKPNSPNAKYGNKSTTRDWEGGFGRKILGETWIDHHGEHGKEGTRGILDGIKKRQNHAVLRGIKDIWGKTDVYGTRQLNGDAEVLVWGLPTKGMNPNAKINWEKSAMPIAWIKHYTSEQGNTGRVFTTTMGASIDLVNQDLRRLIVNGCYWAIGMDQQIPMENNVEIIGDYNPTMYGFGKYKKNMVPSDYAID